MNEHIQDVEGVVMPRPPYAEGSFNVPKIKEMIAYIVSRRGWIVEIEGGKRGGKDVFGIYAYSQYLMITPDTEHLVLGRTLEHAITTVLRSHGFGIMYCIPQGKYTRETVDGGTSRGVFKFVDAMNREKRIYFYGNEKESDYTKFKGFTLGSVYINEANEQHPKGIKEAKDRTNSAMFPRIVITQNPKGSAHPFYTDFEAPLIATTEENMAYRTLKVRFADDFEERKAVMMEQMEKERTHMVKDFYRKAGVTSMGRLTAKQQVKLQNKVRDLKEMWNKNIRSLQVKQFTEDYDDISFEVNINIREASMAQIIEYVEVHPNPNNIGNGLGFAYFHFTHDDNLSMSDADRARIDASYDTKSPTYQRDIRGLRATVDHAIWATFGDWNIFDHDIPREDIKRRVLSADLGYEHEFGVLDSVIDHHDTIWVLDEILFNPNKKKELANNVDYIDMVWRLIRQRYDGYYSKLLVDPSAKGFINQARTHGKLIAVGAKNRVRNYKGEETTESDKTQDKKVVGINLVREGFRLRKIMVHRRCVNLIKQIQSYGFDPKKLELGVEAPIKIKDDLNDPLRYIANTEIGYTLRWERGGVDIEQEQPKEVLGEQVPKEQISALDAYKRQQVVTKQLIQAFKGNGRSKRPLW
jgi:hypothetical protein